MFEVSLEYCSNVFTFPNHSKTVPPCVPSLLHILHSLDFIIKRFVEIMLSVIFFFLSEVIKNMKEITQIRIFIFRTLSRDFQTEVAQSKRKREKFSRYIFITTYIYVYKLKTHMQLYSLFTNYI